LLENKILIVGAGLAGLFLALKLSPRPCIVLSQSPIGTGASSAWAQGGMAAALGIGDSPKSHADDTIAAGAGLVDEVVALMVAEDGPKRIKDLLELGVPFDTDAQGNLELGLEAAHTQARVARVAGDLAGREIMKSLIAKAQAASHITILENHWALALLQSPNGAIGGVIAGHKGGQIRIEAAHTVLATGGIGGLYSVTTNPIEARGQGLGMAARCGALICDPEFVQFHPTSINIGRDPAPLASEALRGDGAVLRNADGTAFMAKYHKDGDLAPRDIVARAVAIENQSGRGAFLDARTAIGDHFPEAFPTVFASCISANIDPRSQMIPITPAEHYHMGGIATDLWGKTSLQGLSAIGECASTGLHGANRLASNSLLEAVVMANRVAISLRDSQLANSQNCDAIIPAQLKTDKLQILRRAMSEYCGVVRSEIGLKSLLQAIDNLTQFTPHELPNELITARLIALAAQNRTESRGGHWREDYPQTIEPPKHSHLAIHKNGDIELL
jgi:L-aspartate oxidase